MSLRLVPLFNQGMLYHKYQCWVFEDLYEPEKSLIQESHDFYRFSRLSLWFK
jgi:hypothetical protein